MALCATMAPLQVNSIKTQTQLDTSLMYLTKCLIQQTTYFDVTSLEHTISVSNSSWNLNQREKTVLMFNSLQVDTTLRMLSIVSQRHGTSSMMLKWNQGLRRETTRTIPTFSSTKDLVSAKIFICQYIQARLDKKIPCKLLTIIYLQPPKLQFIR